MGKTRKHLITQRRESTRNAEHWLGFGIDGQDALLLDLDPYLYVLDSLICRIAQQTAFTVDERFRSEPSERPKAAILLGYDLNPWTVGFLSERFDVALVSDYVDPIVEETADRFNAVLFDDETFYSLEPVFDFVLRFECTQAIDGELLRTASELSNVLLPGGRALFPISIKDGKTGEQRAQWIKSSLGFREYTTVDVERASFQEIKNLPDFGVGEFARRHRAFYGKEARDLCLKRIYERDFQAVIESETNDLELIVATR